MRAKFFLLIILTALFASCRTPERLVEIAVKRKPELKQGAPDTLRIVRTVTDTLKIQIGDTTIDTIITRPVYVDTVINCDLIEIERRKTRAEIRRAQKLQKIALKQQAKIKALELKNERLRLRLEARNERQENRQETAKERVKKRNLWWLWLLIGAGLCFFIRFGLNYLRLWLKSKNFLRL